LVMPSGQVQESCAPALQNGGSTVSPLPHPVNPTTSPARSNIESVLISNLQVRSNGFDVYTSRFGKAREKLAAGGGDNPLARACEMVHY
jgi:hypothetical protein